MVHDENLNNWQHAHDFGQGHKRPGELRTIIVVGITAIMMIIEIAAGIMFSSMALLADGLHMASHAAALSISTFAYIYARRRAHHSTFSFGTGKVNALGGFTSAILLAFFALMMIWQSVDRMMHPITIAYNQAILVAILGLLVNGFSVFILGHDEHHNHLHNHHQHDHNLRAAYLHVMADALTSLLAIVALLSAKYAGLIWMDPLMGIVGAILVSRWSLGLLRSTSKVLLNHQGSEELQSTIRDLIESDRDNRIADLHVWSIGPDMYATIISIVTHDPMAPEHYKQLLPVSLGIVHISIEVHLCQENDDTLFT